MVKPEKFDHLHLVYHFTLPLKILWNISFPCKTFKMQITADVSKISKTVQCDLTFILNFFQNLAFILPSFQ